VISESLLRAVVVGEVALVAVLLGVAASHSAWLWWDQRRSLPLVRRGRAVLAAVVAADMAPAEAAAALAPLPARLQSRLVAELASSLRGAEHDALSAVAASLGLVRRARRLTESRSRGRRLRGAYLLIRYGAADFPTRLLDDPDPGVRAQALEWLAEHPAAELVPRVVALLADPSPLCRFTARDTMLRTGIDPLALLGPEEVSALSPQALEGVLELAAARPDPRHGAAGVRFAGAGHPGVRARAAALLGAAGGGAAAATLESMLDDGSEEVRRAAAAAVARLGHWPAAAAVARLLRDPSWDVRASAAEALTRLGSPGLLLLRRYAGDDDPFASDMARQQLELAELRAGRVVKGAG
jgi:HEAT repeat protein